MCDFSQYGGPSPDWTKRANELPPGSIGFDTSMEPATLQRIVNDVRGKAAGQLFETLNLAPKVQIVDHKIPTRDGSSIQARSYRSVSKDSSEKLPVFLFYHGGGFIFGSLESEDATCAKIAINTGVVVVHANYRHTPEFKFPTAWLDAQDAFEWVHKNMGKIGGDAEQVVVGGVSAGGELTASVVLEKQLGKAMMEFPPIAGQVLMIPCLASLDTYSEGPLKKMKSPGVSSYVENEHAPVLPKSTVQFFYDLLKTGPVELRDTKLNPINATSDEVKGMPPTVFGIAGLDPLRDEGLLYAKLLSEAGVPTNISVFKGVPHAHAAYMRGMKASGDWDEVLQQGILWTLSKPKATGTFEVKVKA